MRILLIENEKPAALAIKEGLKDRSSIDLSFTGQDGLYQAEINEYDAIILDLGLPDGDGTILCQEFRRRGIKTPLLVLTARTDLDNKILCLDSGADDFLSKPFNLAELQARLRALVRRNTPNQLTTILSAGDIHLDLASRTVTINDHTLDLRRKEFMLLEYFLRHSGQVIGREVLFERIWGTESNSTTNTVDVHIKLLRDKIDKPYGTNRLKTVHGMGYKLEMS